MTLRLQWLTASIVSASCCRANLLQNHGQKFIAPFALFLLISATVVIQITPTTLNASQFASSSQGGDGNIYDKGSSNYKLAKNDVHLKHNISKNRETWSDAVSNFEFLTTLSKKIHHGWLQGRTTPSKAYFDDLYISMTNEIYSKMQEADTDRWSQLQDLSRIVREKIDRIQNPPNCNEAKLLVYDTKWHTCGFGCNLHTLVIFFMQSIYANRTFVLQSADWNYDKRGWEHHLLPLGKCKFNRSIYSLPLLTERTKHIRVVSSTDYVFRKMEWAIPTTILSRLDKIHSEPYAWWVAQFVAYAFRIQPWFQSQLHRIGKRIGFKENIVGIQVRRGDKLDLEAVQHGVDEYMDFVETWFRMKEAGGKKVERIVFVATENSNVWVDLKARYPKYRFIGSGYVNGTVDLEPEKKDNYKDRKFAIESIITDIYFLSKCEYVVCTLSSNICRVVYELMIMDKADASNRIQSIDVPYLMYSDRRYIAVESHIRKTRFEIDMEIGDEIVGRQNPYAIGINGSYRVLNTRTNNEGDVPAYKLKFDAEPFDVPIFDGL